MIWRLYLGSIEGGIRGSKAKIFQKSQPDMGVGVLLTYLKICLVGS